MDTITVFEKSDRKVNKTPINVRTMTRDEVMALGYGSHPEVILNCGSLGRVKINGKIRTFKRDANRVEIPCKYGMYEFATLDLDEAMRRFVVRV